MGGEEECARTGDSNPGCNYLVRGYSPSMHFFWGGDMPHYSPPLPFWRGRVGCPCVLASPRGRPARGSRTCTLAGMPRLAPRVTAAYVRTGWRVRAHDQRGGRAPSHPLGCDSPALLASLCYPFSGVFPFLDRYISLARKIRYVTIKPGICFPWLACNKTEIAALPCNYGAAIREKSVQ